MTAKRKTPMTADAVERQPHRYPTRWKLRQDTAMTTVDAVEKLPHDHSFPTSSKLCRNNTPYLPREIIFNILIFIPAKPLFQAMRYVCKQWYDIVSDPDFVRASCLMSTPGFLIQDSHWPHNNNHMIHIEDNTPALNLAIEIQIPFPARVVSCFNGLLLLLNSSNTEIFHVVNPLTKENISLPPLKDLRNSIYISRPGLSVDSCGHYKVVVYVSDASTMTMRVFTIGVDKAWRFIDHQAIPFNYSALTNATSYCPQSFGGFIYWFTRYTYTTTRSFGFAFDIDTETLYQFSQPKGVVKNSGIATFVSMGTSLGFILEQGFLWKCWKLADVKSGEWIELAHINVSTLYNRFKEVFDPCVNMLYYPVKLFGGQLWLYRDTEEGTDVVRYNFVNENMVVFPIKININHGTLLPHANTLVSLKNC